MTELPQEKAEGWATRDPYHQQRLQAAIAECAQRFAETRDLYEILRDAVAVIRDQIGLDRAGIFLFDEDTHCWRGEAGTDVQGRERDERNLQIPVNPRHPLRRAEAGEGWEFFTADFEAEFPDDEFMRGVKNHYLVALRAHGHILGAISVDNLLTGRPIDEETREDLRRFARYVALALENLRLRDRLEAQNEQLQRANEELKDFAHVVSHDLKSPLQSTIAMAEWVEEDYGKSLDEEGLDKLNRIKLRLKQMGGLIEGILRYSRADKPGGEPQEIDTVELVGEIVEVLAPSPGIRIHVEPDLPKAVYDRTQLQQVFQNLLGNAVTYMDRPEGDIWVGFRDAGKAWEFTVRDTGHGIEEQHMDKIFRMFHSVGVSGLKESTGIGLAVVQKIVESNGGKVWVESKLGAGSCFHFTVMKR
ncbi:MAG: GAF domain-containing protein [Kiritimatiellae bacterium]|nr:GAF domain-containing protein [Kiritimatiellia bacterium]